MILSFSNQTPSFLTNVRPTASPSNSLIGIILKLLTHECLRPLPLSTREGSYELFNMMKMKGPSRLNISRQDKKLFHKLLLVI